ncbi:MAG: CDP-alcohol phosphatidyltransferase family protein [Streptosporangiales bacterium]|nr:CDP-alcohol phosphatidyltransferase family protein [Streptosporangiales bacterium]
MPGRFTAADVRGTLKTRDSWWTVFFVDPLAAPLVKLLANRTNVTPNQLSLVAFVLGLGSAAAFLTGNRWLLALGGVLFHLAFLVDCLDGKIARLKGTGTTWGKWLDFVVDRVRIFLCMITLVVGQYLHTGEAFYLILGLGAIAVEGFRYINAAQAQDLRREMRAKTVELQQAAGDSPKFVEDMMLADPQLDPDRLVEQGDAIDLQQGFRKKFGFYDRVRRTLRRHRIRTHLWSGVEYEMFVCIVGPLTGFVASVIIGSAVLLLLFEGLLVYQLWLQVREFDRMVAAQTPPPPTDDTADDRVS